MKSRGLPKKSMLCFLLLMGALVTGCADKNGDNGYELIEFTQVAEFSSSRGQATIKLYTYSGEDLELQHIRAYAETLGCGMVYAYFYPAAMERDAIPVDQINAARNFKEAEEILFQGQGSGRWHFASQCLGVIPTVVDCRRSSLSMQCR